MFIFPLTIVLSLTIYLYFKVQILRTKDPLHQEYTNAKARMALGLFITAFGANQYVFYQTRLSLFIGIVFIVLGIVQITHGFRKTKFYGKQVKERLESTEA